MKLTDEQLAGVYLRATGVDIARVAHGTERARAFVKELFDLVPPAGVTDGTSFADEEWMLEGGHPVWERME